MNTRFVIRFTSGSMAGRTFSLGRGDYLTLGSDPANDVHIVDDPLVSSRHGAIYFAPDGKILYKDLGSKNGSWRKGRRLEGPTRVRPGHRVTLGRHCTFQSSWWNALQASELTRFTMLRMRSLARRAPISPSSRATSTRSRWAFAFFTLCLIAGATLLYFLNQPSRPSSTQRASSTRVADSTSPATDTSDERRVNPAFVWDEIVNISRRFGDAPPSSMDKRFVDEVVRWISRFTRKGHHRVLLQRRESVWPIIEDALRDSNLPIELGYVVWAESEFDPTARSPVGAAGLWQFMPDTAREYGLRLTSTTDDRLNPRKSSRAAARYFTDLLAMFGPDRYLLALAAYNTGQFRVKRQELSQTIRPERAIDFWHIKDRLPAETADYVPKILAAIIIGRNPDRW